MTWSCDCPASTRPSRRAAQGYPWPWSVYRWLDGEDATVERIADPRRTATELGRFVAALQRVGLIDGPPSCRGVPLAERDEGTRTAIAQRPAAWDAALRVPTWQRAPVWIHGDLNPGNLLAPAVMSSRSMKVATETAVDHG